MKKHYEILKDERLSLYNGKYAYRIRATIDLPEHNVKKGDFGGYVSSYFNLNGNAWVADDAMIVDRATAYDNVLIKDNAIVKDSATICDNVCIKDNAIVEGHVTVSGNSKIYDRAILLGDVSVEDATIYGKAILQYGRFTGDIKENLVNYIACSLNILPMNNKYILYKRVYKTKTKGVYRSIYDPNFIYKDNEIIEIKNYDNNFKNSCSTGIHCSTPFYWDVGATLIAVEVDVKDIITCMEGKIRAKRVKVLGEVKLF